MNQSKKIYIHKPSKIFIILSILIFFVWLNYLPINWRPIDDHMPLRSLLSGKISLMEQYRHLFYWFKGSYPPIWHFWAFTSYSLKNFGMDLTRYVLVVQGYISIMISALLMSSLCQSSFFDNYKLNNSIDNKILRISCDCLSIIIIGFNPQIVIHSSTYMPYNLGFITTLYSLLFIYSVFNNRTIKDNEIKNYFGIPYLYAFLIFLITLTFIFQSLFVILPAILITLFIKNKFNFKVIFIELKQACSKIFEKKFFKNNFFINISFISFVVLILAGYVRKLLILFLGNTAPGEWAFGINSVYKIKDLNLFSYIKNLTFNVINIIGQSLYPFKYQQYNFALFITLILILVIFLFLKEKKFKFVFSFFFLIYSIAIIFATFTNLNFSPTRHNIYLLPFPIFFIIVFIVYFFLKAKSNYFLKNNFLNIFTLFLIFNFYCFGFTKSLSKINYPKDLRSEAIAMAKDSDYYLDLDYINENNTTGYFQSHGNQENNALRNKLCTKSRLEENKKKSFKLFLYSSEEPIDFDNPNILDFYIKNSRGCLNINSSLKILRKIEYENYHGFEQNLKIKSTAHLYAYLVLVE